MNFNRRTTATLAILISLILSSLFINYSILPLSSEEPPPEPTTRYLHKEEPLVPVHLHKEEPLTPVHLHPMGTFDPTAPIGSMWHELYPIFSNEYNLTSWEDTDLSGDLTPSDQIDLTNIETGEVTWFHLDRVTWTILIQETGPPPDFIPEPVPPIYAELETAPYEVPPPITDPVCTDWHVIHPPDQYSRRFHIWSWNDTGEPFGEFSPSDHIDVEYRDEPEIIRWYHVQELYMDLVLTKKCFYEPVSTQWHELHPNFSQYYHIDGWQDTDDDGKLSSSDQIDLHMDWPKFHHDNPLSGYTISTAPNTNTTLWKYNTTAPVYSSPAIVDNTLYIGSLSNRTYALDATTGGLIWSFLTGGPIHSSPAVFYGNVYILSTDGFLYALDAATGALVWSVFLDTGPTPWSSPAVSQGRVFVAASDGWIHCLDAFTGFIIWSTFVGGQPNGPIAVANNKVFSGTHNFNASLPTLVALDELSGVVIWTYNYTQSVPGKVGMVNSNGAAVVDGDGDGNLEVYFGIVTWTATGGVTGPGEAIALQESNGAEIWRYSFLNVTGTAGMGPGWSTSTPAVHGGKVFIGSDDQNVYALNAATGAKIWNYTTKAAVWSAPAVADGKVFAGSLDHILYALNENTGALIWSYNTSKSRIWPSPAVACGKVFVGSENGNVIAFGPRETKPRWHHVDRVTVTIKLKEQYVKEPLQLYAEFKGSFEEYFEPFMNPLFTNWHIVYPPNNYSRRLLIWNWTDNGDGVLGFCDYIEIYDLETGASLGWYHVEEVACDIILTKKCWYDPIGSPWHELYPDFSTRYNLTGWEDTNGDEKLSPSDYVELTDKETGAMIWSHLDNLTLTIKVSNFTQTKYLEFVIGDAPIEDALVSRTKPVGTPWHEVHPDFCITYVITNWDDNCNGVLDYSDWISFDEGLTWWHVEEVACDIMVTEIPPFYWKQAYPNYAPSGMPDFDQRQDNWTTPNPFGGTWWTWCAPTAVANSLWWMDSRFHPSNLLTNYTAAGEHHLNNTVPFIKHLAYLMDTEGQRTGLPHSGTWTWDMETGIAQYLSWSGVNPQGDVNGDGKVDIWDKWIVGNATGTSPGVPGWNMAADIWPATTGWPNVTMADNVVNAFDLNLVLANMNKTGSFYEHTWFVPDFYEVEAEIERSEDVVLVLGFWYFDPATGEWTRAYMDTPYGEEGLGHAVTVAGVNSATLQIAISDPALDAFEAGLTPGRSPVPHVHMPPEPPFSTHNNASLVSHDIYNVTFIAGNPAGTWALQGYVGNPQAGVPPGAIAVVEAAVITSPLGVHDVAVIDVKPVDPPGDPLKTIVCQGYSIDINVTVENQGDFTETFNVTLKANTTIIGNQKVTDLASGNTANLTFTWSPTTSTPKGNYTLTAVADTVSGEMDTADNTFTYGKGVYVSYIGDITGATADPWDFKPDGKVDGRDLFPVSKGFGAYPGIPVGSAYPIWHPNSDINNDKKIDGQDIFPIKRHFGELDP